MRQVPLKLYLALSEIRGRESIDGLYRLVGARDFLFSFAYGANILKEIGSCLDEHSKDISLIIDSGAFSAWNVGREVDINAYAQFCHSVKSRWQFKEFYIVNLDVIPGKRGQAPTHKEIIESAAKGSENAKFLRSQGLFPIEVFHQAEDEAVLHRMIQNVPEPYIGVSPANDVSTKGRKLWLDWAFRIITSTYGQRVRTHGFGVTGIDLMANYNWTSVDSASYQINAGYGGLILWDDVTRKMINTFVGSKSGGMRQMQEFWSTKHRMFPDFVSSPKDLESGLMRNHINAFAYLKARDNINNTYRERPKQVAFEEICK